MKRPPCTYLVAHMRTQGTTHSSSLSTWFLSKFPCLIIWNASGPSAERYSSSHLPAGGSATLGLSPAGSARWQIQGAGIWKGTSFLPPVLPRPARPISSTLLLKIRRVRMKVFITENHLLVCISFIHSSNIYWAHTMFQALFSTLRKKTGNRWKYLPDQAPGRGGGDHRWWIW